MARFALRLKKSRLLLRQKFDLRVISTAIRKVCTCRDFGLFFGLRKPFLFKNQSAKWSDHLTSSSSGDERGRAGDSSIACIEDCDEALAGNGGGVAGKEACEVRAGLGISFSST